MLINKITSGCDKTDFGVDIKTKMGSLARFCTMDRNIIKKICAVALTAIALGAITLPGTAMIMLSCYSVKLLLASSLSIALKTLGFVPLAVVTVFSVGFMGQIMESFNKERENQLKERRLIEALGGKTAFDNLPKRLHFACYRDYMDWLSPESVGKNPITVGVDSGNRPFVAVCVKDDKGDSRVEVLHRRYSETSCPTWVVGNPQVLDQLDFAENVSRITKLMKGERVSGYKLVK